MFEKPRIGISSCVLGNEARHDGGHKRDRCVTDTLAQFFDFGVAELKKLNLNGYILKKDSPSCGMERVRVYGDACPRWCSFWP